MEKAGALEQYRCPLTKLLLVHPQYSGKGKGKTTGFNLASPTQLGPVLVTMIVRSRPRHRRRQEKPAIAATRTCGFLFSRPRNPQALYQYKKSATRTQMVDKLIKLAEAAPDGRIHADYNQIVRSGE